MTAGRSIFIKLGTIMIGNREIVDPDTVVVTLEPTRDLPGVVLTNKELSAMEISFDTPMADGGRLRRRKLADDSHGPEASVTIYRRPTEADIPAHVRDGQPLDECESVNVVRTSSRNINLHDIRGMIK